MTEPPFVLPDFHQPYAARLNAHLGAAREYARAWATGVGLLDDPELWTAADLERHDYGLLCASAYPACDAEELQLLTAWHAWAFYVDDWCPYQYRKTKHLPVVSFPGESPQPPANPAERALADLWTRTLLARPVAQE